MEIHQAGTVGADGKQMTVGHSGAMLNPLQKVWIEGTRYRKFDGCHTVIRTYDHAKKSVQGVPPKDWQPISGFLMERPASAGKFGYGPGEIFGQLSTGPYVEAKCGGIPGGGTNGGGTNGGGTNGLLTTDWQGQTAGFNLGKYGNYILLGAVILGILWYTGFLKMPKK